MKLSEIKNSKGTYVGYKVVVKTQKELAEYMDQNEIPNPLDPKKIHTTLIYSRKYLPDFEPRGPISVSAKPKEFVVWKGNDGSGEKKANCLILLLSCPEAEKRHKQIMDEYGATFDYDKFQPHITLSYDIGDMNIKDLKLPDITIEYSEEYEEDLDLDWAVNNEK